MYDKEKGEKRADTVLFLAQSIETKVDEQHSNYQVACTLTGHMHSDQRGQYILFPVVFTPFTPSPSSRHDSVWLLPVIAGAGLPIHMIG
jgi:hypothetical protein